MSHRINDFVKESKIVAFFANFNKNLLRYFYGSEVYKCFMKINILFRNIFLKNMDKSTVLASIKKIVKNIESKDIGLLILLVAVFNTLIMIALGKKMDIFSAVARTLFSLLGASMIFRKK